MTEPSVRRALLADGETDRDILPVVEMPEAENMSEEDRPEILSSEKTEQTVKELQSEENAQKEISGLQEQQNQDVKVSNGKIQKFTVLRTELRRIQWNIQIPEKKRSQK